MAYDEATTDRFRRVLTCSLGHSESITEKRMMGGTCFMLNGNMVGGADKPKDGTARFMFRIGKENREKGEALPLAQQMEMGGRVMGGFFFVEAEDCDDALLGRWIDLALDFVKTLPAK